MGGQQFLEGSLHIDMGALQRVLAVDTTSGLLHIEAGADWPTIIAACHAINGKATHAWSIRQKQTGVDAVSLGGSIAANAHGRGLAMQPIGDDIEDLTLLTAQGEVLLCNREQHSELFALAIGGYGLFGIIYSATLRLALRRRMRRLVDIVDIDDALNAVQRRVKQGCQYGDFQFVIDAADERFLQRGVLSCYTPADAAHDPLNETSDLTADAWLKLLKLAHDDKKAAFKLYAQHYLNTDGNHYWSDSMQLTTYLPSYAEFMERTRTDRLAPKETLVIGEHYVPLDQLLGFMRRARSVLRRFGTEVIYGTIRAIRRDTVSFLPWASTDSACVIFNLRTPHTDAGRRRTADTFRALIDAGIELGGSFFLTYHRYATARQVEACYPQFRQWLKLKQAYDPGEIFISTWYRHYKDAFAPTLADCGEARIVQ